MYVQHCGGLQQSTANRAKNILFHALWVLYALTTATVIIDMLQFCWNDTVNMEDQQTIEIQLHLEIIQYTVFACCDFMAQIILVCSLTTGDGYHLSNPFKRYIVAGLFGAAEFVL